MHQNILDSAVLWKPALAGPFGGVCCLFVGKRSSLIELVLVICYLLIGFKYRVSIYAFQQGAFKT